MPNNIPSNSQNRWIVTSQLQGIPIRFLGDRPEIRNRVEEFLRHIVGGGEATTTDVLTFSLGLLDGQPMSAPRSESKTLIQFASVSCFLQGNQWSFHAEDGSFINADIESGQASGSISKELLKSKPYIFSDLVMAPLMEMLKERGFYGLHAAAVMKDDKCYLFPGDAQSGKTTVALSLVRKGFQYLADDKLLLREAGHEIAAMAFTRRFNIDPDIARYFTELGFIKDLEPLPLTVKRPFDISNIYSNSFVSCAHPKVLIHVKMTPDAESRLIRISPTESFTRLAHQTILSGQKKTAITQIKVLGHLVNSTESYLLYNGRDMLGAPERILNLLAAM